MIKNMSICITGVDGTGKSTIVKKISEMFGDDLAEVQYMGSRDWETSVAKIFVDDPKGLCRILRPIGVIIEFYHRVYKHRNSKKIIIFDRYVDEMILALKQGVTRKRRLIGAMFKFFLEKRFYQPTITFYLTCDIETSVYRKDDINTETEVNSLKKIKKRMDEYYINKKNVVVINTSYNSIDETLKIINERLRKEQCFSALLN